MSGEGEKSEKSPEERRHARSYNMSQIKSKNTKPERVLRSLLHRAGYRFRLHSKQLPGKPDIVFNPRKKVIFMHGCFWHRHEGCRYASVPKTNVDFRNAKFEQNVMRDAHVQKEIKKIGWSSLIVWECEIRNVDDLLTKLHTFHLL